MGGLGKPLPINHGQKLGTIRILLTLIALAIFVTSFMLVPVKIPPIAFS